MNKKLPAQILFSGLLFFIMLLSSESFGQEDSTKDFINDYFNLHSEDTDSTYDLKLQLAGFSNVKYYYLKTSEILAFKYLNNVNEFVDSTKSSPPFGLDKIDFNKNSLVLFNYHGGDCHAKFKFRYTKDDEAKVLTVKIFDYYGGCRAGGRDFTNWAVIPKLPEDYKVEVRRIMVDKYY